MSWKIGLNEDSKLEKSILTRNMVLIVKAQDPVTGAYHVESNFLKPNTDYRITAEITAIGSQIPQNQVRDTFNLRVIP